MKFHYIYAGAFAVLSLAFAGSAAQAQTVLTAFNFNTPTTFQNSTSGAVTSTLAFTALGNTPTSTTTSFRDTGTGTTKNEVPGDHAGNAGKISGGMNGNGSYLTFGLNATGYTVSSVSFAIMSSAQGFGQTASNPDLFEYSTDGFNKNITTVALKPVTQSYAVQTFNFTSLSGLNNNANDAFRIVFNGAPSAGAGGPAAGTNSIDNLQVDGASAAPEPSQVAGLAFFVIGFAGLALRARKRASLAA